MPEAAFEDLLIANLPNMRAYAMMIARNREQAEDLVQDSVARALAKCHLYQPGTNFKAWVFTVLRNQHIDGLRARRREAITDMPEDVLNDLQIALPRQDDHLVMRDLMRALKRLSADQRDALLLVTVQGMSYEEAAAICGCPIGTIRSRLARARMELHRSLLGEEPAQRPRAAADRPAAAQTAAQSDAAEEAAPAPA